MNTEDVLSLEGIAENENKHLEKAEDNMKSTKELSEEILRKIDTLFEDYIEQLLTIKRLYKEKIMLMGQKSSYGHIKQDVFALAEYLRANFKSFNEDPKLLQSQMLEDYLRNFIQLRNFQIDRLLNFDTVCKTMNDSIKEFNHALKSNFETLKEWTFSFLDGLIYRTKNK